MTEKTELKKDNWFFFTIFVAIITGWILIQLWTTTIEVFFYSFIGLSDKSALDTFSVSVFFTLLFFILINLPTKTSEVIKSNMTGIIINPTSIPRHYLPE
jgi:hypothetical protein